MELKEDQKDVILRCVLNNYKLSTKFGGRVVTVQEILTLGEEDLRDLFREQKKIAEENLRLSELSETLVTKDQKTEDLLQLLSIAFAFATNRKKRDEILKEIESSERDLKAKTKRTETPEQIAERIKELRKMLE